MITFRAFCHSKTFPIFGLLGGISERFRDVKPKLTYLPDISGWKHQLLSGQLPKPTWDYPSGAKSNRQDTQ